MAEILCPICSTEMIEGYVNAPEENFLFYTEENRPKYLRTRWHYDENKQVMIKRFKMFDSEALSMGVREFKAHYCPNCMKIILNVSKILNKDKKDL